ncbi:hypothetical protein PG989_016348 [Apiospora arundinis]
MSEVPADHQHVSEPQVEQRDPDPPRLSRQVQEGEEEEQAAATDHNPEEEADDPPPAPTWLRRRRRRAQNQWRGNCLFRLLISLLFILLLVVILADQMHSDPQIGHGDGDGRRAKITHIASLGSSYAAGPGIPPQRNQAAGRSGNNYAALLQRRLSGAKINNNQKVALTDLSVSGATLLNLISEPQDTGLKVFAPQVDGVPDSADLVLVLGGGNDIDYIGGLMRDAMELPADIFGAMTSPLNSADALARRYGRVLDAVHHAAPKAVVLVVEYLTLLGSDFVPGVHAPFGEARARYHRQRAEMLNNGTRAARAGREGWCHLVQVSDHTGNHGIGAAEPWVTDYLGVSDVTHVPYHPNAAGMKGVEEIIYRKLIELELVDDDDDGEL